MAAADLPHDAYRFYRQSSVGEAHVHAFRFLLFWLLGAALFGVGLLVAFVAMAGVEGVFGPTGVGLEVPLLAGTAGSWLPALVVTYVAAGGDD